jgi:hypothetical protein
MTSYVENQAGNLAGKIFSFMKETEPFSTLYENTLI